MVHVSFYKRPNDPKMKDSSLFNQYELHLEKGFDYLESIDLYFTPDNFLDYAMKLITLLAPDIPVADINEKDRVVSIDDVIFNVYESGPFKHKMITMKPLNGVHSDRYYGLSVEERDMLYNIFLIYYWYSCFNQGKAVPNDLNVDCVMGYMFDFVNDIERVL